MSRRSKRRNRTKEEVAETPLTGDDNRALAETAEDAENDLVRRGSLRSELGPDDIQRIHRAATISKYFELNNGC